MSKYVIASGLSSEACENLNRLGFEIISFHDNKSVGREVRHHADLSFLDCNDGTIFIAREMNDYKEFIESLGYEVRVLEEKMGNRYPDDVPLNCAVVGSFLICNIDTISQNVLQYFKNKGSEIINVNQGYTKCSVIPVCNSALITDDESIGKKCSEYDMDVLIVSKGSVMLEGFDYGFIGGATGKLNKYQIVFNGDVNSHTDVENIICFLNKYGIEAVSLAAGPLYDVGSIIPLYRRN